QMARAAYKDSIQADVHAATADAPLYAGGVLLDGQHSHLRLLEARGVWMPELMILLDNRVQHDIAGEKVVTSLRLEGNDLHLLVNRGWIRDPQFRSELPQIETPAGVVAVEGIARIPNKRFIKLSSEVVSGMVWQNLTMERYASWS